MSALPELAPGAEPGPARLLRALLRGDAEQGREPLRPEHLQAAAALALALEAAARAPEQEGELVQGEAAA